MTRAAQRTTQRTKNRFLIRPAHDGILRDLATYGSHLTCRQILRLRYSTGSQTLVQALMKELSDARFCQRLFLPRPSQHGSAPLVYTLARRGLNYLTAQGIEVHQRYHRGEEQEHGFLFLAHTLHVAEFLISLSLFARRCEGVEINEIRNERALTRNPVQIDDGNGGKTTVTPDAWIRIVLAAAHEVCLVVELDRATAGKEALKRKIKRLVKYALGPYADVFATTSITICFVTTGDAHRLTNMIAWTEQVLEDLDSTAHADLFRFTNAPLTSTPPQDLFLGNHWYRPFDATPLPLIDTSLIQGLRQHPAQTLGPTAAYENAQLPL